FAQRTGHGNVGAIRCLHIRLRLDRAATRPAETEQHARSHDDHEPRTPHRRLLSSRKAAARRSGKLVSHATSASSTADLVGFPNALVAASQDFEPE
ncbi:hypothetical protein, partial [Cutibacterium avidum]|uniref:hypothetical protein n=2 Tax=Cutibacterium avidum TaxID=33010 RepID=UPI001F36E10E